MDNKQIVDIIDEAYNEHPQATYPFNSESAAVFACIKIAYEEGFKAGIISKNKQKPISFEEAVLITS